MPEISVLMGVHDCASTVGASIESIRRQTFGDWELIVCDDGSADGTVSVVESYRRRDPRIHLLRNDGNRKLAYTLNRCLEASTGRYCARMDGDDLCDESRLELQHDFLERHREYGFVSTAMRRFDEDGIYDEATGRRDRCPSLRDYVKGSPFCHAAVMMRRSAYERVGGYRDLPMTVGVEDYDLWFRLLSVGIRGYVLGRPLYSMYDGRGAARRRTWRRRLNEFRVRSYGYGILHVPWLLRLYALKPLAIGLLPDSVYRRLRLFSLRRSCF